PRAGTLEREQARDHLEVVLHAVMDLLQEDLLLEQRPLGFGLETLSRADVGEGGHPYLAVLFVLVRRHARGVPYRRSVSAERQDLSVPPPVLVKLAGDPIGPLRGAD